MPLLSALLVTALLPAGCAATVVTPPDAIGRAYDFLYDMMDRQATGNVPRLPQSYIGGTLATQGFTSSTTYDDALVIDALIGRAHTEDVTRAGLVGDALILVQANDPAHDGRVRASYAPGPPPTAAPPTVDNAASDVGAMAWAGQALLQLYHVTRRGSYLDSARSLATWIQDNSVDQRGAGGYTGGLDAAGTRLTWKSTEHNLDVTSFFTLLGAATGQDVWADRATHARTFVESMYDPTQRLFWTGTDADGTTTNRLFVPADTQTWSYLVLRDNRYAGSLDFVADSMGATDGAFHGISATADERSTVWFEGTAQLAEALRVRSTRDDLRQARQYLNTLTLAQTTAPNNDGHGIVAASRDSPVNGQGARLYASLHTGATAWYVLAGLGHNPFQLITAGGHPLE